MASGKQEMQTKCNVCKMFIVIVLLYGLNRIVEKLNIHQKQNILFSCL